MSFLAPLFLLGTLAIALPVIFHLIRRSTKDRLPFSSLQFLSPTPPRLTRRSRLEHLLLLALRCAIICLLAFAFARPFLKSAVPATAAGESKRILLLLDTSASIRRADLWPQAVRKAVDIASRAGVADTLGIIAFDRHSRTILSFSEWSATAPANRAALVQSRLKDISPGWFSTSLGQTLIAAADTVSDKGTNGSARTEIVVISDLQEGSRLDPVQGYEWPKGVQVSLQPLKLPTYGNASLELIRPAENETRANLPVRVRVSNSPDAKREQFKLTWFGVPALAGSASAGSNPSPLAPRPSPLPSLEVYVPAGQSRVFSMPDLGTNQREADRVVLTGDGDDFDNTLFVAHPEPKVVEVAYVANEAEGNPKQQLYFLKRAFQETYRQKVRISVHSPDSFGVPALAGGLAPNLIVTPGPLSAAAATQLGEQVRNGKVMLFTLVTDRSGADLARLLQVAEPSLREASGDSHSILAAIDFQHPLFAPFAEPRFSDFSKIHFWKHRILDVSSLAGARVLARFDGGDPALVEVPAGKGRVYILTSGWQPEDSQLALSTKFVPLLYSFLEQSGAVSPAEGAFQVGDSLPIGTPSRDNVSVRTPAGAVVPISAGKAQFTETTTPGIYTADSAQEHHPFAVNLDPLESRTAPLKADAFEALGAPLAGGQLAALVEARRQVKLRNADLENRQKIWRWVILGTLVVVLLETWAGARAARRARGTGEAELEVKYGT